MNKKSMKKTLSSIIISASAAVAIPVIATSIINNQQNNSIVSKQTKGSFVNGEDANQNSNFKVTALLVGTYKNNEGVLISSSYNNKFPVSGSSYGNWYYTESRWEKSYDGQNFTKVNPDGYDNVNKFYLFNREDKEFQVRRVVDWYYNNATVVSFTTNSSSIKINKKISTNVVSTNVGKQKVDYKIYINGVNDATKESIQYTLSKEVDGNKTIVQTSNIVSISTLSSDDKGFFFDLKNIERQLVNQKYTFEYAISTTDTTKRTDKVSFDVEALSKDVTFNKPTISSESNEYLTVKIAFEKYNLINDYIVKFALLDDSLKPTGKFVDAQKINDLEYKILKTDSDMKVAVNVSSAKLGVSVTDTNNVITIPKKVTKPVGPSEPEKPVEPSEPEKPTNPDKPSAPDGELPDNNGVVNSTQNSAYNNSTIAVITTLSLIALIAVICSIVFFINMRKNNKK